MTTVSVTFVKHNGDQQAVAGKPEDSLMQLATWNDVNGILGDCGGAMTCATCHIKIAEEWWSKVGAPAEDEVSTMEMSIDVGPHSRLACQVKLSVELDGLVVHVPKAQF
jgi:ferredoxin, 2Fe-2S